MSPLGTFVATIPSPHSCQRRFLNNQIINDPLLKLMSVSLVNEGSLALNLNHHLHRANNGHHLNRNSSSPTNNMHLKSGQLPGGSPIPIPSPNGSVSAHPESPQSQAETAALNDDDEVLSIGRDDDQMVIDCDSSVSDDNGLDSIIDDDGKECHMNTEDSISLDPEEDDDDDESRDDLTSLSPPPRNETRMRNYSSEDSSLTINSNNQFNLSIGSNNNNNHHLGKIDDESPSARESRASLLFSIANILRPDFGLPSRSSTSPSPIHSRQHLPHHNNNKSSHSHHHHHTVSSSTTKRNHSGKGHLAALHLTLPKLGRHEAVIPIDLSRPSSTGSAASIVTSPKPILSRNPSSKSNRQHNPQSQHRNSNGSSNNSVSPNPTTKGSSNNSNNSNDNLWPAWVYCTRYSDRPSSGPRTRRGRKKEKEIDEKRPRTAFTAEQLSRLKKEFEENRYLTEKRRQDLARDLRLHENQIKIWFQNKRAKLKKATGQRGGLAMQLMAQGLYNHSTIPPKSGPGAEDDSDDE